MKQLAKLRPWMLVCLGWVGSVLGVGCDRGPKPGLGLQVIVIGNGAPGERAKRIEVVFDRSMVAAETLGRDVPASGEAPFRLEPSIAGSLRWREDRKLSFEPAQPLPRSTAFIVTVPKGTRGLDGVGITEDFEHKFETERLTLAAELARDFSLPDPKRWATPTQKVKLSFNQPVLPSRVASSCKYRETGGTSLVTVEVLGTADAREQLEAQPSQPLRSDTGYRFGCDGTLAPVEGTLPFAATEPSGDATGQAPHGFLDFRTFGPFVAKGISPSGQAVSPDATSIAVHFSTPPVLAGPNTPIQVSPRIQALSEFASVRDSDLVTHVSGLQPYTEYTVTMPAGLLDAFGQKLTQPLSAKFKTGSAEPGYALETGSWSVEATRAGYVAWTRNVNQVEVMAASLSDEQLFAVLPSINWWDRDAVDLAGSKVPFIQKVLSPRGDPNRWNQLWLSPKELIGEAAGKSRFHYIASRSTEVLDPYETDDSGKPLPQGYKEVLLNVTNLGVTSKLSGNSGLVWVTRLSDGAGQPGAEVTVRERSGAVLWRGTTGADGSVSLPGRAALLAKLGKGPEPGGAEEEYEGQGELRLLIFARLGDDATFVDPDAAGRFSSWSFGVQNDTVPKQFALRGFLHTDRGLYRPGDTVHLRGLARLLRLNGGLFVPAKAAAEVTVSDPKDREVARRTLPLSKFGGFSLDQALSEAAPLGDYRVRARLPYGEFSETFTVEEFRAATFEVELQAKDARAFSGDVVKLSSSGRYFYGAPVRSADVTLRVHTRARDVHFDGHEDYSFMDEARRYDDARPYGEEAFITEQVSKLDAEGKAEHLVTVPAPQVVSPSTLLVSSTVQDETNQTVTANLTLPLHQTRLYLGVDTGGWVAEEKKPQRVRFVAMDVDGKPVSAPATYRVEKQNWSCAWERWGYRGSYRCTPRHEIVASGSVSIAARPFEQSVSYPGPGEYLLSVEGVDSQSRPVRASRSVWVYGAGESAWRADDSGRFKIIADKKEYRVGDTARLILQAPVRGARALISVERDGVLSKRTLPELSEGQAIEVPVTDAFAPNAFVSVLLVRGRMGEGARGLPQTSMGLVDLRVGHAEKRLNVEVLTDAREYRPGKPVTARLRVKDAAGVPVQAEVALAAADEGVLSLIAFKTPDPLTTFFAPWGLAVRTASQYERLAQLPAPEQERYVTGGDSAGMPGSFRSRFRATAYWNPSVVTNEAGEASVTFDAPDNLTAFRLMAVAADEGDRFGSAEQRFVVNKPLQLISALPRFLSVGDRFEAAAMLTNETGAAGAAKVRFSADGAVAADAPALEKTVTLGVAARQRVAFPVMAKTAGSARFRIAAALGEHEDGLEVSLPVYHPAPIESELLSEGATEKAVNVAVRLPEGVLAGTARLEIGVDPDGLAGLEEGLRDLVQYPYGCLEQTTSRLIPLIAARELTRPLAMPELDGEKLERYIRMAVGKVLRHQTMMGGFGSWPGSPPEPYLTAYALWGLKLAADAGYEVDAAAVQQGINYLRMQLLGQPAQDHYRSVMGELGSRAFALHVLALLGQPEPALATALAEQADALPYFGQAFLARALAAAVGPTHASVTKLLDRFQPTSRGGAGTIVKERDGELDWYYSTDVRTSAIVVDTLVALRPDDARLPELVRGVLAARRARGWYTTQENLYALVALTHYAKARAGKSANVRIARGDQVLLSERLTGEGLARLRRLEVPIDQGDTRPLSISTSEGTAHYRVRAVYQRDSAHQAAANKGLDIRRVFLDPETGAPLERAKEGQMVRVKLTLASAETQHHVALSDYLPAGLEPINARFATVPHNLPPDDRSWYDRLWLTHRELGDERVDAFVDWMPARSGSFEYLARATSVGTFVVPAATAEKMYDPDVNGRTALRSFEIVAR